MKWEYCPECGCNETSYESDDRNHCLDCGQEWFSTIDYSDVVACHLSGKYRDKDARIAQLNETNEALHRQLADYEEVNEDKKRLVRELDRALNGDGAAKQASLCDIVCQVKRIARNGGPLLEQLAEANERLAQYEGAEVVAYHGTEGVALIAIPDRKEK